LLIGPTLSPQLVRSATATSKPSLFTDLPRASRPIPRRSGNGLRVGQSRDSKREWTRRPASSSIFSRQGARPRSWHGSRRCAGMCPL